MTLAGDFPIRTSRLQLRPVSEADCPAMLAYRGRADVCRYLPFEPMTKQVLLARLRGDLGRREIGAEGQGLTLAVEHTATGRLIGDVVLFYRSAEHRHGELGYVFSPDAAGQGLATEACRAALQLGFEQWGWHRIIARMDARNRASARLAERLGMRREAHLRQDELFKGEWSDLLVYAILAAEWQAGTDDAPGPTSD